MEVPRLAGRKAHRPTLRGLAPLVPREFMGYIPRMFDDSSPETFAAFGAALLDWFAAARRPLPWREHYAPYGVWVSEIMLQQTQMERGVEYYLRWMKMFPDVAHVAAAPEEELLKAWEGLGYYRRVRNLQAAARVIMQEHGGVFPSDFDAIRKLPGIGDYTAGAIASIAFNQDVPAVDANVERVFSRLFDIDTPVRERATALRLKGLVERAIPSGRARDFNQALMELGALVCRKTPDCGCCPVTDSCESLHLGIPGERPVPVPKKAVVPLEVATGVLVHDGRIYVQKRPEEGVWAGFWELPGGRIEAGESPEQAVVREFMEETGFAVRCADKLAVIRHGYTTYRVTLHCHLLHFDAGSNSTPADSPGLTAASAFRWVRFDELDALTLPAGHRKLVDKLRTDLRFAAYR